jgi:hypothetical protein
VGTGTRAAVRTGCLLLAGLLWWNPGQPPVRPVAPPGGAPTVRAGQIRLPFDAYRFGAADQALIARARRVLQARCMRARGFAGFTVPDLGEAAPPAVAAIERRYGVVDPEVARRFGYHFPPDPAARRRLARREAWEAGLTAPERVALRGSDGDGGCVAQTEATLRRGTALRVTGWFTPFDFASLRRSRGTAPVRAATRDWRRCMAGHGLHYATPDDAVADPAWDLNSPAASAAEIRTAVTDVRCKDRSHLTRVWYATEVALQNAVIAGNRQRFAELAAANARYLANAARALGRTGSRVARPR